MALIICKDCKKEFSTDAKKCPHCGAKKYTPHYFFKGLIIFVFICWIVAQINKPNPYIETTQSSTSNSAVPKITSWYYGNSQDSMTSKNIKSASIDSINTIFFDFPYSGAQNATLQLRNHPRFGKDVILSIEKGQFLCRFDGCNVLIRFDEEKPINFSANEPSDNSTTYIFINGYDKFINKMQKAKKVRIAAEFYQSGTKTLEFDVSSFDKSQYKDKK